MMFNVCKIIINSHLPHSKSNKRERNKTLYYTGYICMASVYILLAMFIQFNIFS